MEVELCTCIAEVDSVEVDTDASDVEKGRAAEEEDGADEDDEDEEDEGGTTIPG